MPRWRERIFSEQVDAVRAALSDVPILSVDFDFLNCLVRITVPDDMSREESKAIEARARAVARVGVDVRPPAAYPYTMHLRGPVAPVEASRLADRVVELEFSASDLDVLRDTYVRLRERVQTADVVATFALGGLVPLHFVTRVDQVGRSQEEQLEVIEAHQRKFHLFPGLLWEGGHGPRVFKEWLCGLPSACAVIVFDTTFTGNAVNRIRNIIEDCVAQNSTMPSLNITVLGIFDESRGTLPGPTTATLTSSGGATVVVATEFMGVNRLLSEDKNNIIGYDSLRTIGAVDAQWSSAVVRVVDDCGASLEVIGTRSLPATFASLLDGPFRRTPLPAEMVGMSVAMGIILHINQAARQERNELNLAFRKGLVTSEEFDEESRRIERAEQGARQRYERILSI